MISLENLKEFREHILDLAIRGKLVDQRPEEGTAEDLYQQIQEEKQNLIKEGKLKKEKTLAPIEDDEIPFDIPENWKWVRWGNLSKFIQYGLNEPAKSSGEFKYVRISDIQDGKVNWENTPYCDISSAEAKSYLLKSNDILFARTGGTVGKSFLVENVPCDAVFAGYLIRTQCSDNVCPKYCKLFMESNLYWNQLRSGTVATAQPNCNGTTLSKMMIPLPPLAEQKRIVAKVESYLSVIEKAEDLLKRKVDLDGQIKEKILQMAIQGKLVEQRPEEGTAEDLYQQIQEEKQNLIKEGKLKKEKPLAQIADEEIPFDIPDSWRWVRVADLIQVLNGDRGKNYPSKDKLKEIGIPFVSASNLDGKTVVTDSNLKCLSEEQYSLLRAGKLQKDDILVCIRGSLGKCATYPFDKGAIASSLIICRPYIQKRSEITDYVMNYLNSNLFYSEISKYDNGTAQPNLAAKDFCKFLLPLPPLAEQKRIVAKVEELLALCDKLKLK